MDKPAIVTDAHMDYLDRLRETGKFNMFGAGPNLVLEFGVTWEQSRVILGHWMRTFSERHPAKG